MNSRGRDVIASWVRLPSAILGTLVLVLIGTLAAAPGEPAVVRASGPKPVTISSWHGWVVDVAQDPESIAWWRQTDQHVEIRVRSVAHGTEQSVASDWFAGPNIVLAGGKIAWGGYQEVRCADTHWVVYTIVDGGRRQVARAGQSCLGYGDNFTGLVSDGANFFYSVATYSTAGGAYDCDPDRRCTYRLAGGGVYRIVGGKRVAVHGFPAAADIAASNGRIAVVEPIRAVTYRPSRTGVDIPRSATNGLVEIRRASDASLISRFRPRGVVRSISLSAKTAVVLVESDKAWRIEWYDVSTGARLGAQQVTPLTGEVSVSGNRVVFPTGKAVRLLNLQTHAQRVLWRGKSDVYGLSILGNRVVWGEYGDRPARVLELTLP